MNKKILKWIEEGKTDVAISKLILKDEETKDFEAKEIAGLIAGAKKEMDIASELKKIEDEKNFKSNQKLQDSKDSERINKLVEEKLKSIQIDPFGRKFQKPAELKHFNPATGLIESVKTEISDAYAMFNAMIKCVVDKDIGSAKAISLEIDQDNLRYRNESKALVSERLKKLGIKTALDAIVSDVDARGAYAIPTEVEMIINQLIYMESVMLANMNTDNIIFEDKIYPLMYGITVADIADQDTQITESQATFANPTVTMQRSGAFTNISNTILKQKGADLTRAITSAYASAFAEFLDLRLAVGNVTNTGDLVDGIAFDPYTKLPTAIALSALTNEAIAEIQRTLSPKAGAEIVQIANRKVVDKIGLTENTGGQREYPQYLNGGSISPFGVPMKKNAQIPSTLDVGGDARTGGTDDVLLTYSKKHCVAGISGETRMDFSAHDRFTYDQTVVRGIKKYGSKVLSSEATGGVVAIAQELTN